VRRRYRAEVGGDVLQHHALGPLHARQPLGAQQALGRRPLRRIPLQAPPHKLLPAQRQRASTHGRAMEGGGARTRTLSANTEAGRSCAEEGGNLEGVSEFSCELRGIAAQDGLEDLERLLALERCPPIGKLHRLMTANREVVREPDAQGSGRKRGMGVSCTRHMLEK
jgi:hypothetical protein